MLKKIQDAIEKEMARTGATDTETVNIIVCLTGEELYRFLNDIDYKSNSYSYSYRFELSVRGVLLYLSYTEIVPDRARYDIIETNDGSAIFVQYTNDARNKVCFMYDFRDNYADAFKAIEAIEVGDEIPYLDWNNNQIDAIKDFNDLFPYREQYTGWNYVFDELDGWTCHNTNFYRWWKNRDR